MCGISGIISKNKDSDIFSKITKMNNLIIHRGPDGEGVFIEDMVAFGHRRLSIIDLSDAGHQPMHFKGKYTITFNGEIYNYIEIRNILLERGYEFSSETDTEVILAAYDYWGEDCVNRFNGMWAFAIYNKEKQVVFCSRDRFGVKPFYYHTNSQFFYFGSEIKQCLSFIEKPSANTNMVVEYLVSGIIEYNNDTFFDGIKKLPASHNLIFDLAKNNFEIKQYYSLSHSLEIENLSEKQQIKLYQEQLEKGVKLRLRSDVKVGTCLSGGVDSSTVAAIGARNYDCDEKFTAIHAKSLEKQTDESVYAQDVANHTNLNLKIIEPTTQDFIENIDEVVRSQEEPFGGPSIFMQYFVMKKAKELGCKVMLDGQGGDETLIGYEKYYPSVYLNMLFKHGVIKALKEIKASNKNNTKMNLRWISTYFIGALAYNLREKLYYSKCSFIKKNYRAKIPILKEIAKSYYSIFDLQHKEITATNLPVLLRYEDKNSMWHSVEARLPFVDYQTLEMALHLSSQLKIKNGWTKYVLRCIAEKLIPINVAWRKNKLGFNAPDKSWLDAHFDEMHKQICNSKILAEITDFNNLKDRYKSLDLKIQWRLFNIAVWERIFKVQVRSSLK